MEAKQYQSRLNFVKLDQEMTELKTQKILRIVGNALARQAVLQLGEGQGESIVPASRAAKVARSAKRSAPERNGIAEAA